MAYKSETPYYCLNLNEKYVGKWTWMEGLRQIYQNWMDQINQYSNSFQFKIKKEENTNKLIFKGVGNEGIVCGEIVYNKIQNQLKFSNFGSFQINAMLMGVSSKVNDQKTLGQFGEGMKLTMIVLLREGFSIEFHSGSKSYFPKLKEWQYDTRFKVLHVKITDRYGTHGKTDAEIKTLKTQVIICGISEQQFENFRYTTLGLVDNYIIIQPEGIKSKLIVPIGEQRLSAKLFKKGVQLGLRQKLGHLASMYSYDFDQIEVGRDRDCVNNVYEQYNLQSQLHAFIINTATRIRAKDNQLRPLLDEHEKNLYNFLKNCCYNCWYFHSHATVQSCDKIYLRFMEEFNNGEPDVYPISSNTQQANIVEKLKQYGLNRSFYKTVTVSWIFHNALLKSSHYKTIQKKLIQQLNKAQYQIPVQERNNLNNLKNQIGQLLPQIGPFTFKSKLLNKVICYKEGNIIIINKGELNNLQKLKREFIKIILN